MKTKKQNGITLIALVVTIIILLILAAVTTSFVLSDNGIFNKAAGAVRRHTIADEKEQITMAFASCRMQLIQNRITVSVVDTKKYAAISSGSSNEENEVQETNNTVDTPLDDEDLVTAPMLQRALNGSKEDTDSKIALVTSDRTKYELDVEFTKTHNQYTVSARNGEFLKVPDAEISVDGQKALADLTAYFNSGEIIYDDSEEKYINAEPIMDASTSINLLYDQPFADQVILYDGNLYTLSPKYSDQFEYLGTDVKKLNIDINKEGIQTDSNFTVFCFNDIMNNHYDICVTNELFDVQDGPIELYPRENAPSYKVLYNESRNSDGKYVENHYYFNSLSNTLAEKQVSIHSNGSAGSSVEKAIGYVYYKTGYIISIESLGSLNDYKITYYNSNGNFIKYFNTDSYSATQYDANDQQVGSPLSFDGDVYSFIMATN